MERADTIVCLVIGPLQLLLVLGLLGVRTTVNRPAFLTLMVTLQLTYGLAYVGTAWTLAYQGHAVSPWAHMTAALLPTIAYIGAVAVLWPLDPDEKID